VPIGLAVALVWLEIGIAARRRAITTAASAVPLFLVCLAMAGDRKDWVYQDFLERFIQTLGGSPAYLAAIAAVAFLLYAAMRRVPAALELMAVALGGLAVIGPRTIDVSGLVAPRWALMAAAGVVLAAQALWRRDSSRALLSAACLVVAAARGGVELGIVASTWPVALHLAVAALMAVGLMFDDGPARMARGVSAVALSIMGLYGAAGAPSAGHAIPAGVIAWYPLLIAAWAGGFGVLLRDRIYCGSAGISLAAWLLHSGIVLYDQLRNVVVGLDQIAWGMLFFLLAMAISLRKAGLWPRASKGYDPLLAGEVRPPDSPTEP
jgi:hypothetical protein